MAKTWLVGTIDLFRPRAGMTIRYAGLLGPSAVATDAIVPRSDELASAPDTTMVRVVRDSPTSLFCGTTTKTAKAIAGLSVFMLERTIF